MRAEAPCRGAEYFQASESTGPRFLDMPDVTAAPLDSVACINKTYVSAR